MVIRREEMCSQHEKQRLQQDGQEHWLGCKFKNALTQYEIL